MFLYRHFSPLDGLAVKTITSCTGEPELPTRIMPDLVHTHRTTLAASAISKLVTLPGPLVKHTHFFVCALTLSSITHISLWATLPVLSPDQDLKQQLRMNMGALKAAAPFWPAARMGLGQVTGVARRIWASRKEAVGEVFWSEFVDEDFMNGLIENNGCIDVV